MLTRISYFIYISLIFHIIYTKSQNEYGKFKAQILTMDVCRGPKRIDCSILSYQIKNNNNIKILFEIIQDIIPNRGKITAKLNGQMLLKMQMKNPCHSLYMRPIFQLTLNATSNCEFSKGHYVTEFDVNNISQKFYGGLFFYGNITLKAVFYNDNCNFGCVDITAAFTPLFINNEFVDAVSKKTFPTINPHDESVITQVAEGDKADIDAAVNASVDAFHRYSEWRKLDASERGLLLYKLAELVDRDVKYLSELETLDCGKPLHLATDDILGSAQVLRYYAGIADKIQGNTIPADGEVISMTLKEPVGVCGQIIPWNYPVAMFVWKVAPALAAGCTVVVKPAEQTPLTALAMAALVKEAGFPAGVVNVVPGYGGTAGFALTHHKKVDKIVFTGSTEVGSIIMSDAAAVNIKRLTLQLGGNSPLVVFNDTDVEKAAQIAHEAAFTSSGQCCSAARRTYVQSGIYDKFVAKAAELAIKRTVGNPFEDVAHGPQIDCKLFRRVLDYINIGKDEGARCVAGGNRLGNTGFYIQPTVFADVEDDMRIAKEEIFGPVQTILKFETFEEGLDRANNSVYGLAAGVITNDIDTALKFVKHVRGGSVWVNTYDHVMPQAPFGGFGDSGIGRDLGEAGVQEYLETKTVTIRVPKDPVV